MSGCLRTVGVAGLLLLAGVTFLAVLTDRRPGSVSASPSMPQSSEPPVVKTPGIGDVCRLIDPNDRTVTATVVLATDLFSFERAYQLTRAKDTHGIEQLYRQKRIFEVRASAAGESTRIRILTNGHRAAGLNALEIRVLDGEHEGRAGFVNSAFVVPE